MLNTIEICKKQDKNGRRRFKMVLHEVFSDDCVGEDGLGTAYQDNGITWIEQYCQSALNTISGMSIRVQFLDDERTQIFGHGATDLTGTKVDGLPLFEDATVVGHFEKGYITDINIDDVPKKVCVGEGILDEMCYPNFVHWLEEKIKDEESVFGSIEIFKKSGNKGIVYLNGHAGDEFGRVPTEFIYSGFAMLDCCSPADKSSRLMELNSKKTEVNKMDEKTINQITETIKSGVTEVIDKSSSYETKISELNSIVEKKNEEISTLNQNIADLTAALEKLRNEQESMWNERNVIEKELGELRAAKRIAELNTALEQFTDYEKNMAKESIDKFCSDPNCGIEINSIVESIKIHSYDASKAKPVRGTESENITEINSRQNDFTAEAIFGGMDMPVSESTDSINIDELF